MDSFQLIHQGQFGSGLTDIRAGVILQLQLGTHNLWPHGRTTSANHACPLRSQLHPCLFQTPQSTLNQFAFVS